MTGLALLIPIALCMGLIGLVAFFWALRSGQFEDIEGAAARILIDDEDGPEGLSGAAVEVGEAQR
jgi:cbb3-type cytochrome oxidase maturation protein